MDPDVPQNVMDTYCWIHSTFSIPNRFAVEVRQLLLGCHSMFNLQGENVDNWRTGNRIGKDVPHPNVRPESGDEERTYHKYYQWVCFTLFFQAIIFYIPR